MKLKLQNLRCLWFVDYFYYCQYLSLLGSLWLSSHTFYCSALWALRAFRVCLRVQAWKRQREMNSNEISFPYFIQKTNLEFTFCYWTKMMKSGRLLGHKRPSSEAAFFLNTLHHRGLQRQTRKIWLQTQRFLPREQTQAALLSNVFLVMGKKGYWITEEPLQTLLVLYYFPSRCAMERWGRKSFFH